MLQVNKANIIKSNGKNISMYFEFIFDNASNLPTKTFNMGTTIYSIANGSIAKNIQTNTNYIYNSDKWTRSFNNDITISTNTSNITENGNYSIINNPNLGVTGINVNVESGTPEPETFEVDIHFNPPWGGFTINITKEEFEAAYNAEKYIVFNITEGENASIQTNVYRWVESEPMDICVYVFTSNFLILVTFDGNVVNTVSDTDIRDLKLPTYKQSWPD